MAQPHTQARSGAARPWRTGALAAAAAAGGVAIASAGLLLPGRPAAAAADVATSVLVNLTIDDVPALGLTAFHGTYATSGIPQNGGDHAADPAQDPDGVLQHITIAGPASSKTHSDPVKNWAQSQLIAAIGTSQPPPPPPVMYFMNGTEIYTIASLDSYAECTSPPVGPYALAYVHTDANAVNVLGTIVPEGTTVSIPVTGAQIGVPTVDHGTLSAQYTTTADPPQQTAGATSAHAHMDLVLSGTFYDVAGTQLYSGPVQQARFGDVTATCQGSEPTTSSTSVPTTTPVTPPTTPTSASPPPTTPPTPPTPTTVPTSKPHPPHHSSPSPGGGGQTRPAGTLPDTGGGSSGWWMALSAIGLGAGTMLLFLATRRHGKHL
ncbi:LPXTG cell wall anchor domain-containing protein [Catenulispora yoronensis]